LPPKKLRGMDALEAGSFGDLPLVAREQNMTHMTIE
jgi:hypothetical protein